MKKIFFFLILLFTFQLTFAKPVKLILDWFANPDHAPLFVAEEFGFFKKNNLDIQIISPADPSDAIKLLAANQADLAVTYESQLIRSIEKGFPIKRVAVLIETPLNCLVVREDSGITELSQLKGKKIGYSQAGADEVLINAMLKNAKLSAKDVTLINVHYDLTQALLTKKVDAVVGMMRNFELLQMQLTGVKGRAFYPEENGIPIHNELVISANYHFLNRKELMAFLKSLNESSIYLVNHPEETWQKFAKLHPELNNELNHQAWQKTLPLFALRPTAIDKKRFMEYVNYLQTEKLITKSFDFDKYVNY